jgi:hypothetical protein
MQKTSNCLVFVIFILFCFSCSEKQNDSTVELDDIRPKSNYNTSSKKTELTDSIAFLLNEYNQDSINLNIRYLRANTESCFLNRFPHLKSANRSITTADSLQNYLHEFYLFKDSIQMKNAFFNWLDCNGKKCESIKLYEERKIESNNLLVISTSKSIDILRSQQKINPEEWIDFVRFKRENNDFKYILFQKKNQKAKWFVYKERKLIQKEKK